MVVVKSVVPDRPIAHKTTPGVAAFRNPHQGGCSSLPEAFRDGLSPFCCGRPCRGRRSDPCWFPCPCGCPALLLGPPPPPLACTVTCTAQGELNRLEDFSERVAVLPAAHSMMPTSAHMPACLAQLVLPLPAVMCTSTRASTAVRYSMSATSAFASS